MTPVPISPETLTLVARLIRRHRPSLALMAEAEQRRQVGTREAQIATERDPHQRAVLVRKRDEADIVWANIRCWLIDDTAPDDPQACLRMAAAAADLAGRTWQAQGGSRTEHPRAAQFLGLIMRERALREDLWPALLARPFTPSLEHAA